MIYIVRRSDWSKFFAPKDLVSTQKFNTVLPEAAKTAMSELHIGCIENISV